METQKFRVDVRADLNRFMGGVGVASKLLEENMRTDLPPLDPAQPVIFAMGALSTIFPVVTKCVAMFVSPLTGNLGESYAAGRLGMAMLSSGYDAVVLKNKSKHPCYLTITEKDVIFKDARPFWGSEKDNIGRVMRFNESDKSGKRSIIRIGAGGENLVAYACATVDRYRHFGRLGLGACMGSKHLKAIEFVGEREMPITNFKDYFKTFRKLYDICVKTDVMSKYHDLGTPVNVKVLNGLGGLPTLNLRQGTFEHADAVSGETFSEHHQVRKLSCAGCPVGCIHIGQFKRAFAEKGHEYETFDVAYDYELIFALGTFVGLKDPEQILELIEEVEIAGMDAMSTGVALGWATEALENGIISIEDTIVPLKFGSYKEYCECVKYLAAAKNEFYVNLGKGVDHASKVYGGQDYAMQISGNEMTGYHTGYGSLVGQAVGARHSHLDNAGYSLDQSQAEVDTEVFSDYLVKEELERCMLNSLIICLFSRKVYTREHIIEAFKSIGVDMTDEELTAVTRRILGTKLRIKKALGFDFSDIKLPKRFFETPTLHGVLQEEVAYEIIEKYKAKLAGIEEAE
jgi:aldehyde:ferredoxin oxidoreductase